MSTPFNKSMTGSHDRSRSTSSKDGSATRPARLSSFEMARIVVAEGLVGDPCPSAMRRSATCDPMKPAVPVTSIRDIHILFVLKSSTRADWRLACREDHAPLAQSAIIASGRLRDELLNIEEFACLTEARVIIETSTTHTGPTQPSADSRRLNTRREGERTRKTNQTTRIAPGPPTNLRGARLRRSRFSGTPGG